MAQLDFQNASASLTTHVLDIARGAPGSNFPIELFRVRGKRREFVTHAVTNSEGRCATPLLSRDNVEPGTYVLEFHAGDYYNGGTGLFDLIPIEFNIADVSGHYHVPLVVAPGGYSTYRGAPPHNAPDDRGEWRVSGGRDAAEPGRLTAPAPGSNGAGLTIHAIDIAWGRGAKSLGVDLCWREKIGSPLTPIGSFTVNAEGRTDSWLVPAGELRAGEYELIFRTGDYFARAGFGVGAIPFFQLVRIRLNVAGNASHHHIPLIFSPWGYSCYRGS